jgi:hypothetical protein
MPYRDNGKQCPSKPVKPRKKYASKSVFHQEEAKESSEISNPEETMTYEADEMNSGNASQDMIWFTIRLLI